MATALALVIHVGLEGVDVNVEHDKAFDFKPVRTWAWNPERPGDVRMARTQDDDPDAMKSKAEPWILDAVATEMKRRGLQAGGVRAGPDAHLLPAADHQHVDANPGAVSAGDDGLGPPAVCTGDTVA